MLVVARITYLTYTRKNRHLFRELSKHNLLKINAIKNFFDIFFKLIKVVPK